MAKRSLLKNYIYNTALGASNVLFPLVTFPYVARILGPESLGKFNLASAYSGFYVMLASFGVPTYGVREIAKVRDNQGMLNRTFTEILLINVGTSALVFVAYWMSLFAIQRFRGEFPLYGVFSLSIVMSALSVDWLYSGVENYRYITVRSMLFKAASVCALFVFVRDRHDYVIYAIITVAALSGSFLFNIWNARNYVRLTLRDLSWKRHLKSLFIFFLAPLIGSVYLSGDTILLGFLRGDRSVAFYTATKRIVGIVIMFATSLSTIITPRLSHSYSQARDAYQELLARSLRFIFLFCLPSVTGLVLLSSPIFALFGGPRFAGAYPALEIQSLQVLVTSLCGFFGFQVFIPTGAEKYMTLSNVAGAVSNLVLNVLLIPRIGYIGASISIVISEVAVLVASIFYYRKLQQRQMVDRLKLPQGTVTYVLGSLLVAAIVLSIRLLPVGIVETFCISVVLGAGAYTGFLLLVKDELALVIVRRLVRART